MSLSKTLSLAQEYYVGYKLLKLISTPYVEFEAYKLGLIDARGEKIRKSRTRAEKDAMSPLTIMALNFKKTVVFNPGFLTKIKVNPYLALRESMGETGEDAEVDAFIEAMIAGDAVTDSAAQAAGITTGSVVNSVSVDNVPSRLKGRKRRKYGIDNDDLEDEGLSSD